MISAEKTVLRNKLRSLRPAITEGEQSELQTYLSLFLKQQTGTWAAFFALPDEPNIQEVLKSQTHIQWTFPKVENDHLQFYTEGNQPLEKSKFGVIEPVANPANRVELSQLQGILIPAMAYSPLGVRLGRGKGYYDKTLSQFNGKKVGVCFNHQIYESLPYESHDVKVDCIITSGGVLHCIKASR